MSITVTLNTANKPPVAVSPPTYDVSSKGLSEITWVPATGQNFKFVSLTVANNPGNFSAPTVTDGKVFINDTNNNVGDAIPYPYTIVVNQNGVNYSTATPGPGGTGGAPIIRNK
ncbi:MAG: hypothetical protein WBW61_05105 [Rhodanobacteraceae bacterium]